MTGIAAALETSAQRASEFTRSIFGEGSWTAAQAIDFVNEQRNANIASVNAAGQPHAAVVIAASVDDTIYFTVHPQSVLARNITANPRIGISVQDKGHAVMGQGRAVRAGAGLESEELIARLAAATPSGSFTPPGWDGDLYSVDFRGLFAS